LSFCTEQFHACMGQTLPRPGFCFRFSKVGAIVILLCVFCSGLTFENFQLHAQMGQTLSRQVLEKKISKVGAIVMLHTRWRRCIGSLKLRVSFHKRATNHRALLRKMTYEDKASYGSSPPCIVMLHSIFCSKFTFEKIQILQTLPRPDF